MLLFQLKRKLRQNFGRAPEIPYFPGDLEYIRSYFDFRAEQDPNRFLIDEITWNDLDLDRLYKRLNPGLSTSGEQYLYYALRSPAVDPETYKARKERIELMEEEPELRLKLQVILARLGRTRRADLTQAFVPAHRGPFWLILTLFLALLFPAAVGLAFFHPAGIVIAVCAATVNGLFHEVRKTKCQGDLDTVNYTVSLILALYRMRKLKNGRLDSLLAPAYQSLGRLRSALRIGSASTAVDGGIGDVLATLLLLDLIAYELLKNKLGRCYGDVFAVHEALGQLDSAIAIASYRRSLDRYAEPEIDFSAETPYLHLTDLVHPLLEGAVANDLHTERSVLITGSNASGKSTYLKSAAVCVLLAQAVCTCTAAEYRASAFRLYSSMALNDDLMAGESYYIAETRSLKRILDRLGGPVPVLCTVDEVLRGTNTVERIAASSKVLEEMARGGAVCLAATHDSELCDLLSGQYDLYHFEERFGDDGMIFDYRIRPGKASSRNAINLLKLMGFPEEVVSGAHERANRYADTGIWQ